MQYSTGCPKKKCKILWRLVAHRWEVRNKWAIHHWKDETWTYILVSTILDKNGWEISTDSTQLVISFFFQQNRWENFMKNIPHEKFFLNIFVQNCLKSKEQNERDSPFKIDKNFRQNHLEGSDCHNMITVAKLPCQKMNPLSVKWPFLWITRRLTTVNQRLTMQIFTLITSKHLRQT